jgi:hypothetical protein
LTSTPYQINVSNLLSLAPERAVSLFRKLLWAEASYVGISKHLIDVPQCINVADGGIDASIIDVTPIRDDLIPSGISGFQIKAGDLKPKPCKAELHEGEDLKRPIKPEIKRLLDNDGTYVLVLYADITGDKYKDRLNAVQDELNALGYSYAKVRLYSANMLEGFINQHPSVVILQSQEYSQCIPHGIWEEYQSIRLPREFVSDDERAHLIAAIRKDLFDALDKCPIIRMYGLSGIGKTRLTFEILNIDALRHNVLYFKSGESFLHSTLFQTLLINKDLSAIVVIDECSPSQHYQIVEAFGGQSSRIKIITLSHEYSTYSPPTKLYTVTQMEDGKIEEIIENESPDIPSEIRKRISRFSEGSPRIASILIISYIRSTGTAEELFLVDDRTLMNRLIGPGLKEHDASFKLIKRVLRGISLFEKIGFKDPVNMEYEWLADYIGVSFDDFEEVIKEQRDRGIIQGDYYLYVSPFMLRVFLLKEWWEIQGFNSKTFNEFILRIPEKVRADLFKRFIDGIKYISAAEQGREFVKSVFEPGGIFESDELLQTELGSSFFLALAEADPKPPLNYLTRTIGTWDKERLLKFENGRRSVVWALEKAAIWAEYFGEAASLLLKLGEVENEIYANNASGIFKGLFKAMIPSTTASFNQRIEFLKQALSSGSKETRNLVLEAFSKTLETRGGARMLGASDVGIIKVPELSPPTWGELFDAYKSTWAYLNEILKTLPKEDQDKVLDILFHHARGLCLIKNLDGMVIKTFRDLSNKDFIDKKKMISTVISILHYEKNRLSEDEYLQWESLKNELIGDSYSSMLKRYVGMDLIEDQFDEEGNIINVVDENIKKLAREGFANLELLTPELEWLMTTDAKKGHQFGYNVGLNDTDCTLLPSLMEKQKILKEEKSFAFLGGYLQAIYERSPELWDEYLDSIKSDKDLAPYLIELTWRSGMTERAPERISALVKEGINMPIDLRLFQYGGAIEKLSESALKDWIEILISSDQPECVDIAVTFLDYFYIRLKNQQLPMPKELALNVLTHHAHLTKRKRNTMTDYHWMTVGNYILEQSPDIAIELASYLLEYFGKEGTLFEDYYSSLHEVLNNCLKKYPSEIWNIITKYIGPPIDTRAFHLTHWLQGGEHQAEPRGALTYIPLEDIWAWVDEDVENRAWYLASFVPKDIFIESDNICIAHELLKRYGDRDGVRNNYSANYSSGSWWGPASQYFTNKMNSLLELRKKATEANVIRWIDEYVSRLNKEIERERIKEERRGF